MEWLPLRLLFSLFRFSLLCRPVCLSYGGTAEVYEVSPECFRLRSLLSYLWMGDSWLAE